MQQNFKNIVFLITLILALSAVAGTASATLCTVDPGNNIQVFTNDTLINYTAISCNSSLYAGDFEKTYNLASKPTDQQFKKQKEGLENLRTISAGGIPPKGPDRIIMDNMDRIQPMMKSVKTKIRHVFSSFYKKIKK